MVPRTNGRLCRKVCHFSHLGAGPVACVSTELGLDRTPNGRVANELCHTKRRTNTDELAQVT